MEKVTPLFTVVVTRFFAGDAKGTLQLAPDDIVQVLAAPNAVWWDGLIVDPVGNASRGWFPASAVTPLNRAQPRQTHSSSSVTSTASGPWRSPARRQSMAPRNFSLSGSNSITTLKNYEDSLGDFFSGQRHAGSLASGKSIAMQEAAAAAAAAVVHATPGVAAAAHPSVSSRQHSQALTEATNSSVHLVSTEEAISYFQPSASTPTQPTFNFVPVWVPQLTQDDDIVYFNQALNIHSYDLPFIDYHNDDCEYEVPNSQRLMNELVGPLPVTLDRTSSLASSGQQLHQQNQQQQQQQQQQPQSSSDDSSAHLEQRQNSQQHSSHGFHGTPLLSSFSQNHTPLKTTSSMEHSHMLMSASQILTPKIIDKFGRDPSKFYIDLSDVVSWKDYFDKFMKKAKRTTQYLKEEDIINFKNGVNEMSDMLACMVLGLRIILDEVELMEKKSEFNLIIIKISKIELNWRVRGQMILVSCELKEKLSEKFYSPDELDESKYELMNSTQENMDTIELEIPKMERLFKTLLKMINTLSLKNENLPLVFPRYVKNKFEAGNFKNQFNNDNFKDDLFINSKEKSNLLLDDELIDNMSVLKAKVDDQLAKLEQILNKSLPNGIPLNDFIKARNLELLTAVYHTIPSVSNYLKSLESVDFSVFSMIDKLSTISHTDHKDTIISKSDNNEESNQWFYDTTARMIRPMFMEFTQLKQGLHSCLTDLILDSQSIAAEDPEVFFPMKMDTDELLTSLNLNLELSDDEDDVNEYNKFIRKLNKLLQRRLDVIDKLLFNDGLYSTEPILKLLDTIRLIRERTPLLNLSLSQLKDQRMLILNYCTRLMNTDFNIASLFIAERHNTLASTPSHSTAAGANSGVYFSAEAMNFVNNGGDEMSKDNNKAVSTGYSVHQMNFENQITNLPWFLDISEEEKDLIYDFNGLKGGTLDGLILKLIDPLSEFDNTYENTFLMLLRSFTSPVTFFKSLISKYDLEMPEALSYEEYNIWVDRKVKPQQLKIIEVFRRLFSRFWLVQYSTSELTNIWSDFTNDKDHIMPIPLDLIELGFNVLHVKTQYDYFRLVNLYPALFKELPVVPLTAEITKVKLLDLNIDEVAKQLTMMQSHYYQKITPNELLFRSYNFPKLIRKMNPDYQIDQPFESKNISNFIKNCNLITHYTSYMILKNKDQNVRVEVIKYFILLAGKLLYLKNFSSMTAIVSGLGSTSVARLKKTWELVPKPFITKFEKMDTLMSISKNYSEYRNILKFMENDSEPYLPFLGLFLSDLRFTTDGNSDVLNIKRQEQQQPQQQYYGHRQSKNDDNTIINFSKRLNIYNIIQQVLAFNENTYDYKVDEKIICYFKTIFDSLPDNEKLYEMSISIEPRISLLHGITNTDDSALSTTGAVGSSGSSNSFSNARAGGAGSVSSSSGGSFSGISRRNNSSSSANASQSQQGQPPQQHSQHQSLLMAHHIPTSHQHQSQHQHQHQHQHQLQHQYGKHSSGPKRLSAVIGGNSPNTSSGGSGHHNSYVSANWSNDHHSHGKKKSRNYRHLLLNNKQQVGSGEFADDQSKDDNVGLLLETMGNIDFVDSFYDAGKKKRETGGKAAASGSSSSGKT